MKKTFKKLSAFFMVMVLVISTFVTTAFAAESTITYKGRSAGNMIEFAPGSLYTKTDLFENMKDVMPGDTRTEIVTIKNEYSGCDYIKVYMRAVLHDEDNNLISPKVMEELIARQADSENAEDQAMSELAYMNDFLKQLKLTVKNGEKTVYEGHPDSLETGFENGNVALGTLRRNKSMTLDVVLEVPLEMDNRYADRIGEVDWIFVVEERNDPDDDDDDNGGGGGGSKPSPDGPGQKIEVVEPIEPQAPAILPNLPKTGDDTVMWPYLVLLGVGVLGMLATVMKKRKKENK